MAQDGWNEQAFSELLVIGPNGQYVKIYFDPILGAVVDLMPPNSIHPGVTFQPAEINTQTDNAATDKTSLVLESPQINTPIQFDSSFISLSSQSNLGDDSVISMAADIISIAATQYNIITGKLRAETLVAWDLSQANTAAIGNVETVISSATDDSGNPFVFKAGRAYRIEVEGTCSVSVAANPWNLRIRKDTAAGQLLTFNRQYPTNNAFIGAFFNGGFVVGGADVTCTPVLTLLGGAGWTATMAGSATGCRGIRIYDDGTKNNHNGWPTLV